MRLTDSGFGAALMSLAFSLGGCVTPAHETATRAQAPQEVSDPTDLFILMVEAERWGVLLDRAQEGVWQSPRLDDVVDESDMLRADRALKAGAARLIILRNDICSRGMLAVAECDLGSWPAWTLEPPRADMSPFVIQQRSDWLSLTMDRFVALGCEAGRKETNDYQFCSVE